MRNRKRGYLFYEGLQARAQKKEPENKVVEVKPQEPLPLTPMMMQKRISAVQKDSFMPGSLFRRFWLSLSCLRIEIEGESIRHRPLVQGAIRCWRSPEPWNESRSRLVPRRFVPGMRRFPRQP